MCGPSGIKMDFDTERKGKGRRVNSQSTLHNHSATKKLAALPILSLQCSKGDIWSGYDVTPTSCQGFENGKIHFEGIAAFSIVATAPPEREQQGPLYPLSVERK